MNLKQAALSAAMALLMVSATAPAASASSATGSGHGAQSIENTQAGQTPEGLMSATAILERLEKNVSGMKTLSASFVQKKKLAAFSHEIEMSGMVYIRKPSTLAWHVTDPLRYSVLITDKLIRQWDEDTDAVQQINFSGNPMLGAVLEHITVWFSGKYSSLGKDYDIALVETTPAVVRFSPKPGNVAGKAIRDVTVGLDANELYLRWIRIVETAGDSTTINFYNSQFDIPLKEKYFEVKP